MMAGKGTLCGYELDRLLGPILEGKETEEV